jgi:exodeoxyribonuclease I
MGYVFYDTETTGINRVFDQILQFAAIRTDEDLQELERFSIRCRLLPHVVPSPGALRINAVSVAQLLDSSLPSHYQMILAIREKLLAWSPSLFIGYNSVGFDEHLLRQAFYQTLHPPYLTNTNGNCRADALRMVRAGALFSPNAITVPLDESGIASFRLERMAAANGFDHSRAHDAIGDVEATVHMCRLLMERVPDLWSGFIRFTQKAAVIDYAGNETVFCLADFYGGVPYAWLVTSIGPVISRKSDLLVFDLAADPSDLAALSGDELLSRLSAIPKVVRRLRTNSSPIIVPPETAPEIASAKTLDFSEVERRAKWLQSNEELRRRLVATTEQMIEEHDPWPHVEQQIHDSFISDDDCRHMEKFHQAPWEDRLAFLDSLQDLRLKQLGRRLIFIERPDVLSDRLRTRMSVSMAKRLVDGDGTGTWLCLRQAIQEADDLISAANEQQREFLHGHRDYLSKRLVEMTRYLT